MPERTIHSEWTPPPRTLGGWERVRLAMAASAAGGDGSAACLPPRVTRGAQWPSKLALLSAVASLSETLGRSVRVAKSDRSRVIVKCIPASAMLSTTWPSSSTASLCGMLLASWPSRTWAGSRSLLRYAGTCTSGTLRGMEHFLLPPSLSARLTQCDACVLPRPYADVRKRWSTARLTRHRRREWYV